MSEVIMVNQCGENTNTRNALFLSEAKERAERKEMLTLVQMYAKKSMPIFNLGDYENIKDIIPSDYTDQTREWKSEILGASMGYNKSIIKDDKCELFSEQFSAGYLQSLCIQLTMHDLEEYEYEFMARAFECIYLGKRFKSSEKGLECVPIFNLTNLASISHPIP